MHVVNDDTGISSLHCGVLHKMECDLIEKKMLLQRKSMLTSDALKDLCMRFLGR